MMPSSPSLLLIACVTLLLTSDSLVYSSPELQGKTRNLLHSGPQAGKTRNLQSPNPSPRVQSILSSDLKQAHVDYESHPFDRRRKLDEDFDPNQEPLDYQNRDTYESLRIKYIMDPIQSKPTYYESGFDQVLPEILDVVSQTWSKHLSVYPVTGNIPINQSDCFGFFAPYISSSLTTTGVADADMAIFVGAESSIVEGGVEVDLCETGTLAFAFCCSIDQYDRPVIGGINFCINNIGRRLTEEDGDARKLGLSILEERPIYRSILLEGNTATADMANLAIHETCHALGFALNLFKYFRDPETGDPMTPRPFTPTDVLCVDGSVQNLVFPSENTLATRQSSDGRVYHEIVTPRVTQVVRNQFDCQSLTGARIENQPTAEGYNCTGSHWDERLFLSELMGPIFSGYTDILSPLTLALLEDSSWYRVTYENAQLSPYGKGRGCDFVNEPCIVNDQVPDYGQGVFCNTQSTLTVAGVTADEIVCDPTHKSFTACDLFDINDLSAEAQATISDNRIELFSDPNLVSIFSRADYCPLPVIDARLDCTNLDNNVGSEVYRGESRGLNSRCINGQFGSNIVPGCFEIECDASQHKVIIAGQVCDFDGQQLSVRALDFSSATLTCPALATICPDLFCSGECSGRGVCNYEVTPPQCVCDDPSDTSAACSKDLPSPVVAPTSASPVQGMTVLPFILLLAVMLVVRSTQA